MTLPESRQHYVVATGKLTHNIIKASQAVWTWKYWNLNQHRPSTFPSWSLVALALRSPASFLSSSAWTRRLARAFLARSILWLVLSTPCSRPTRSAEATCRLSLRGWNSHLLSSLVKRKRLRGRRQMERRWRTIWRKMPRLRKTMWKGWRRKTEQEIQNKKEKGKQTRIARSGEVLKQKE